MEEPEFKVGQIVKLNDGEGRITRVRSQGQEVTVRLLPKDPKKV